MTAESDNDSVVPRARWSGMRAVAEELHRVSVDLTRLRDLIADIAETDDGAVFIVSDKASLESVERQYIAHTLRRVGGNKTVAAEALGVDPSTLHRKLSRWSSEQVDASDLASRDAGT